MKKHLARPRLGAIAAAAILAAMLAAATSLAQSSAKASGKSDDAPARSGSTRVGFVDIERISTEAKFVRDMLGEMDKAIKAKRDAIEQKTKNYEKTRDDLTRKRDVLTQTEYDATMKESRRLKTELEDDDYELNKLMDKYQKESLAPAMEKILKAVQEVAKREGFELVLRGEMVIHGDPAVDLSDRVIEYLNTDYKPSSKSPVTKDGSGAKDSGKEPKSTPKADSKAPAKDASGKRAPAVSNE